MELYIVRVNSGRRKKKIYMGGDDFSAILEKISSLYGDGDVVDITYDADLNRKFHKGFVPKNIIYA